MSKASVSQAPAGQLWEQFESGYNWRYPSDRVRLFVDLCVDRVARIPRPRRVLDIGCGGGVAQDRSAPARIRAEVEELWGIEPDPKMPKPDYISNYQHALMETAKIPENSIDFAYSCLVMEHVGDPEKFMRALHRCLKPGGEYLFMTMNARHYFVRIASTLKTLRVDEAALRLARGKQTVEEYHYPVTYCFNDERSIAKICSACGFEAPRFGYVEFGGPAAYFPGPSKILVSAMDKSRDWFRKPKKLLELYCLIRKPK